MKLERESAPHSQRGRVEELATMGVHASTSGQGRTERRNEDVVQQVYLVRSFLN